MIPVFADLHPTTRRLLLTRALRSIGQGALVVDFALYLHALQWSAVAIGLVMGVSSLFGAVLSLLAGISSDLLRRKPLLLSYEILALASSIVALISAQPLLLAGTAIIGGFGRGAGGSAGPFAPVEQAWLAENVAPERRGRVYSLNTALGFLGMGLGALSAGLPVLWGAWLPGALAYRPLFALVGLAAIAGLILLSGAVETYHRPKPAANLQAQEDEARIRQAENRILAKLFLVNGFNGLAVGLTGPLMSYWFALRFQVGPEAIGPVMAATFILTGMLSLYTGRLTERIGIVSSVVGERAIGLVLLAALPLMPSYWLAALVYLLRSMFTRGSAGAQQALTVGLVRDQRRGLATSVSAVSGQAPRSVGPAITGYLLSVGLFTLPFYAAAVLQGIYLLLYRRVFRAYEPTRESGSHAGRQVTPE